MLEGSRLGDARCVGWLFYEAKTGDKVSIIERQLPG